MISLAEWITKRPQARPHPVLPSPGNRCGTFVVFVCQKGEIALFLFDWTKMKVDGSDW